HWTLPSALFDHLGLGQFEAHHGRALLPLRAVAAGLLAIEQDPDVVTMRTDTGGAAAEDLRECVLHSRRQVVGGPDIFDDKGLAAPDFSVPEGRDRAELP